MGLWSSLGILGTAASAIRNAINRANANKNSSASSGYSSSSGNYNSGNSGSSGGVASSTTNTLRDYVSQLGHTVDYDAPSGTVLLGGKSYQSGNVPGTKFDPVSGQHYVNDPAALRNELGIATPTPQPPATLQKQTTQRDPTDYINEMKEAKRRSSIAALDKAKTAALGSLDTEQANVAPTYYDKRNQAAAASDVGAMNFANYMAARGIKGNAGAMPEIYRNAGLQGQIGALDRQEASNLAGIEQQRANINTGYASDVAAAEADVESQAMQAMINQYNTDRNYALSQAQLTGSLGDTRTLAGQEYDYSKSASNPAVQAAIFANKAKELEIAAQEIKNSYLPETLKMEAERYAQQVKAGSLDYDTALAQLNQIKRQTANIGSEPSQTEVKNYVISTALEAMKQAGDVQAQNDWLYQHRSEIIANGGVDAYNYLFNQLYPGNELYNKVQEKQALSAY